MKTLLEFVIQYMQVLYLNPTYRFTDSRTRGLADVDASLSLSSDTLRWNITNERGQIDFSVAPINHPDTDNWFWLSLIRQYLEGGSDSAQGTARDLANWLSHNLSKVESLFADEVTSARTCADLVELRRSNSYANWGWPKPETDDPAP